MSELEPQNQFKTSSESVSIPCLSLLFSLCIWQKSVQVWICPSFVICTSLSSVMFHYQNLLYLPGLSLQFALMSVSPLPPSSPSQPSHLATKFLEGCWMDFCHECPPSSPKKFVFSGIFHFTSLRHVAPLVFLPSVLSTSSVDHLTSLPPAASPSCSSFRQSQCKYREQFSAIVSLPDCCCQAVWSIPAIAVTCSWLLAFLRQSLWSGLISPPARPPARYGWVTVKVSEHKHYLQPQKWPQNWTDSSLATELHCTELKKSEPDKLWLFHAKKGKYFSIWGKFLLIY